LAISKAEQRNFAKEITKLRRTEDLNIVEAIVRYAEKKGVEVTSVTKYMSKTLRAKLQAEARDLNLLKR
jgi:hypothetical protein